MAPIPLFQTPQQIGLLSLSTNNYDSAHVVTCCLTTCSSIDLKDCESETIY